MSKDTVLDYMIKNDLTINQQYLISHHTVDSPSRINVSPDEIVYIDKIIIKSLPLGGWLEFHSATDSRLVQTENFEQITRHKGYIYFSDSNASSYLVSYVLLKLIKDTHK